MTNRQIKIKWNRGQKINLSIKESSLFCLSCWDHSNQMPPIAQLVLFESLLWTRVHEADFILFGVMMWELLNIQSICQRKFKKIKTKIFKQIEMNSL
jgi:hypothetical protein